jgi:hypothetical protein
LNSLKEDTKESRALIRHASRTLLKKGHPKALKLHGYNPKIELKAKMSISTTKVSEGDRFDIKVDIKYLMNQETEKNILVDYVIYYLKKNGEHSPKVFRLRDTKLARELSISKSIHFKKVTTGAHYEGIHFIELQINGKKYTKLKFDLSC